MRIFVAGHNGMFGRAIYEQLHRKDQYELLAAEREQVDLTNQTQVFDYFADHRPNRVYLAAAKVGGIVANQRFPADFIFENLAIQNNVIGAAVKYGVERLMFLGSSCIYPKLAPQPMLEDCLLSGELESTNEPYAVAKIAGLKTCQAFRKQYGLDFRCVMPTNLYGPFDNFHAHDSHVIPGLIARLHAAVHDRDPTVTIWGSGEVKREFLHVDDAAKGAIQVMESASETYGNITTEKSPFVNLGFGSDVTIAELARLIADTVGFKGELVFDNSFPDGTPRKLLDSSRVRRLGWEPMIALASGLKTTYAWYAENYNVARK
jgi:GDP-L-fucose synthase